MKLKVNEIPKQIWDYYENAKVGIYKAELKGSSTVVIQTLVRQKDTWKEKKGAWTRQIPDQGETVRTAPKQLFCHTIPAGVVKSDRNRRAE